MTLTLTLEQIFIISGAIAAVGGVLWRVRPYVQGEVAKAVEPLRAEFHAWREESQADRAATRLKLEEILSTIQPMQGQIETNAAGNKAGKQGIVRLSGDVVKLDRRTHNLELKTGLVDLKGAANEANGTAA